MEHASCHAWVRSLSSTFLTVTLTARLWWDEFTKPNVTQPSSTRKASYLTPKSSAASAPKKSMVKDLTNYALMTLQGKSVPSYKVAMLSVS
ncbi:hypothetical protein D3C71_1271250 [compost metagenome]